MGSTYALTSASSISYRRNLARKLLASPPYGWSSGFECYGYFFLCVLACTMRRIASASRLQYCKLYAAYDSGTKRSIGIITDTWYGPPLLAPIFYDRRMIFLIDDGNDLDYLIERMNTSGFDTVYYLSGRRDSIATNARRWSELTAIGPPVRLAHNLTGQLYRIEATARSG